MDKIAANNHFVSMRKEVKKAKAMVAQKLIRKISKLKQDKEKAPDEAEKQKFDSKIDKTFSDTRLLKQLDPYFISKQATLKPGADVWNKILDAAQSSAEERLIARIISKNNIQKRVKIFREENKDLDEWFDEYIEYREKKREIKGGTGQTKKSLQKKHISDKLNNVANKRTRTDSSREKSKADMLFKRESMNRSGSNSDLKEDVDLRKVKEHGEPLHPSWDAKRKEKDLVKMALDGKFKSQKLDLAKEI